MGNGFQTGIVSRIVIFNKKNLQHITTTLAETQQ